MVEKIITFCDIEIKKQKHKVHFYKSSIVLEDVDIRCRPSQM